MSWDFTPYEKITETTKKWRLDEASARKLSKVDWVVTEKLHGAHLCFVTDGEDVRCAKRKGFLKEGDDFFGYKAVLEQHRGRILSLFASYRAKDADLERLILHGELFGGAYPHPEVSPAEGVQAVQTGVYYCPQIAFCGFDIALQRAGMEGRVYEAYEETVEALAACDIMAAQPLHIGSFADAMAYDVAFSSHIPRLLGLPPLPGPNLAEGIVCKPWQSLTLETKGGPLRPVIKRKHPSFAEDQRYHQATKWTPGAAKAPRASPLAQLEAEMLSLLNANRLQSAISKVGRPKRKDHKARKRLAKELQEDIWESLQESAAQRLSQLDEAQTQALKATLTDAVNTFLKKA